MNQTSAWQQPGRVIVDALVIAALSILAAALGLWHLWGVFTLLPDGGSAWGTLVTALPASLLVLAKVRAPMLSLIAAVVLCVVDLVTFGGVGPLVALLDVLWAASFLGTVRQRRGIVAGLAIGLVAVATAAAVSVDGQPAAVFLIVLQVGALLGMHYWWAVAVSRAQELAELHRVAAEAAAVEADRDREAAVQQERESMAVQLHDVVAGHVMAMAMRAEAALSVPANPARDREALQAVRDAGLDAHQALRSMIAVLRRTTGDLAPSLRFADVPGLVDAAREAGVSVNLGPLPESVGSEQVEHALVRVVREALSNAVRHARGGEVFVRLDCDGDAISLRVDSRGGAPLDGTFARGEGFGLTMLAERVEASGGSFDAGPTPDGWSVSATFEKEAVT